MRPQITLGFPKLSGRHTNLQNIVIKKSKKLYFKDDFPNYPYGDDYSGPWPRSSKDILSSD